MFRIVDRESVVRRGSSFEWDLCVPSQDAARSDESRNSIADVFSPPRPSSSLMPSRLTALSSSALAVENDNKASAR